MKGMKSDAQSIVEGPINIVRKMGQEGTFRFLAHVGQSEGISLRPKISTSDKNKNLLQRLA